ncbi:SET domain-containing protein-lysine N-methyltransferase [Rhodovulum steppense]|uniref:SET domain-containing protein n=1 Tax=Rhodovulum steppense TaxID=540251 RepID=A0A4V2R3B8_9RHOB|nr:SET domain-containing protein-lysine N-methyltransferase [Rhodovulum steppense]TCM75897.1 hypothetical protein EV216_13625 [Rhodovulum steppense]
MLLVKHYVAPSPIHGLGLFLVEPVKAGQIVWKYEPTFDTEIPEALLHYLLDPYAEAVRENAEYLSARGVFRLGNDGDIFMNHSDQPTLVDLGEEMRAVRDLGSGEELTCDYRMVNVLGFDPSDCPTSSVARK